MIRARLQDLRPEYRRAEYWQIEHNRIVRSVPIRKLSYGSPAEIVVQLNEIAALLGRNGYLAFIAIVLWGLPRAGDFWAKIQKANLDRAKSAKIDAETRAIKKKNKLAEGLLHDDRVQVEQLIMRAKYLMHSAERLEAQALAELQTELENALQSKLSDEALGQVFDVVSNHPDIANNANLLEQVELVAIEDEDSI